MIINNWSIHQYWQMSNLKYFQGEYFVKRPLLVGLILAFEHVLRNEAWHPIGVPSVVQFLVPQCLKSNNTKSGGNVNPSLLQKKVPKYPAFSVKFFYGVQKAVVVPSNDCGHFRHIHHFHSHPRSVQLGFQSLKNNISIS